MPAVDVFYDPSNLEDYGWEEFRDTLCQESAELFSVPERKLSENDFSVMFHLVEEPGRLTHSVIIRLQLHAYPARVEACDDKARELAERMSSELEMSSGQGLSVGVSLLLAEIGWGSAGVAHP